MKLWVDDVRPAPEGYEWCKSVNEAKKAILDTDEMNEISRMYDMNFSITLIDIDHDAGEFVHEGGDYIKLLDWLEETGRNYPIRIHSMKPVGVENMRRIIKKNGWTEVSCSTCKFKNYAPYDEICARCKNCNGWGKYEQE